MMFFEEDDVLVSLWFFGASNNCFLLVGWRSMKIIVDWLSHDGGGRKSVPSIEHRYSPTARFDDGTMWSCTLFDRHRISDLQETAEISFLFYDKTIPNRFEITEGQRTVAIATQNK